MAKRILTKEKLDKQLTSQTSTSPFMSVRDRTDRRVSFNTREELGYKIDNIVYNSSRQNYRGNRFRGNSRGYGRQSNRENYRNEGYSSNSRNRNRSREIIVMAEIEAPAMIYLDQGPELVQIGIG